MYTAYFSYSMYLVCIVSIIFWVGHVLHGVGEVYLKFFFTEETRFAIRLNNLLLLGYYLVNIGYSVYVLTNEREQVVDALSAFEWLTGRIGGILLVLGCLHVMNMLLIFLAHRIKQLGI